jgi:ZIP family zinc transporter
VISFTYRAGRNKHLWRKAIYPIVNVFFLSLVAGLGTGLGGLIAVIRKPGKRSFGFLMGFTAGVMISLSFLELVNEAWQMSGFLVATLGFSAGALFMFVIDMAVPHIWFGEREGQSEVQPGKCEPGTGSGFRSRRLVGKNPAWHGHRYSHQRNVITHQGLYKTGLLLAVGITIHNLPEGIAVGTGYMYLPKFGVFIALAILLHNIPEGIATALPLCESGVCKWDAFRVAFFSGLVEPIGAVIAVLFLNIFNGLVPFALAFAGGVMMFITLDELVPTAREHGHQHYTAIGIILGSMFVFLLSGTFGV